MSLSHHRPAYDDTIGPNASGVTLPSFPELIGSIYNNLNSKYIFPPRMFTPQFNLALDIDRDTGPPNHIVKATSESLPNNIVEVRVMFDGPKVFWRYDADDSLQLPPAYKKRIHFSAMAHMRRHQKNAHGSAHSLALIEGTDIDLSYCDFWIDMNRIISREEFVGLTVAFMPPITAAEPVPTQRGRIWQIVCRRCGQAVTCPGKDVYWNGAYLIHHEKCKPPAIQAASGRSAPHGAQGT